MKLTEKHLYMKRLILLSVSFLLTRQGTTREFYCVGQSSSALIHKHHWQAAVSGLNNNLSNATMSA